MQREAMPRPGLENKSFLRSFFAKKRPLSFYLTASTCLSSLVLLAPVARAQDIPADTTPQGGSVAAGAAAITQAPGSTTINQSSARTVINWQSFNVGSAASVQFNQPSASAIALNRVITPSPSIIAGQINANGQLVLINQSGVVVTKGADINAESVVLATSNIADKDFMVGHMVFSGAPNPGAKIINGGNITARDAGLVGLVAPQVENDGVITARLGQVVLAGATAFTLDLYGDRLISLDVTKAVRAVDVGGELVPALVTNRGLILADGGKITLTARDADALVTQLIDAGGTLRADSVGPRSGTIAILGIGGDITIAGNLLARGTAAGTAGGGVEALATGAVSVAPGALVDASGAAGGGEIAIGTDLNRASEGPADLAAPRASAVQVAAGAQLHADATQSGNAGRVVLLAQVSSDFEGLISVQGGPAGGNGGVAEISSGGVIHLSGTVLDGAPAGQAGKVLLDPATLAITGGAGSGASSFSGGGGTTFGDDGATGVSTLSAASLASLSGTIILEASSLISVGAALGLTAASALTLASLGDITISAGISLSSGSLEIDAGNTLFAGAPLSATDISLESSGAGGITLASAVTAADAVGLQSGGDIIEEPGGYLSAAALSGTAAGSVGLGSSLNNVLDLDGFSAGSRFNLQDAAYTTILSALDAGSITLVSPAALDLGAPVNASAGEVALVSSTLAFGGSGAVTAPADGTIAFAPYVQGSGFLLSGSDNVLAHFTAGTVVLGSADGYVANNVASTGNESFSGSLELVTTGEVQQSGTLAAANLEFSAGSIDIQGLVTASGALRLDAASVLADEGVLRAATLAFEAADFVQTTLAGPVSAGLLTGSAATEVALGDLNNSIAALGAITISNGDLFLGNGVALDITAPVQAQAIQVEDIAGGIALGVNGSLLASGDIGLTSDTISAAAGAVLSAASVTLAPYADLKIDLGGTSAGALGLGQGVFTAAAGVPVLQIGDGSGVISTDGAVAASPATLLLDASAITFNSAFSETGVLALAAPSGVAETASGPVTAATLIGGGTLGNVGLAAAGNAIGTLGPISLTTGDTLALEDSGILTAAGPVSAGFVSLSAATISVTGALDASSQLMLDGASSIGISGEIEAGSLLVLTTGQLSEGTDAVISAASLSGGGGNGSSFGFGGAGNSIASLAGFTAGSLDLADSQALNITGALSAGTATLSAPGIAFGAAADVPGVLALISSSGVSETAPVTAGTLTSGGAVDHGNVQLNDASIATLGTFNLASGSFILNDADMLTLAGPLGAPSVTLSAPSLAIGGAISATDAVNLGASTDISIAAPVNAGLNAVLEAGGAITEAAGGTISALILTGRAIGSLDLGQTNVIANLSGAAVTGAVTFNDAAALTLAGTVSAAGATLTAPALDFTGTFISTQPLLLATTAGVNEAAGAVLRAPSLSGSNTGGDVELTAAGNSITNLGGFSFGSGSFALTDATPLMAAGTLAGGTVILSAPAIGLSGAILASSAATLAASGNIGETGGTLSTGNLILAAGNITLGDGFNTFGSVSGTGSEVTLADQADLAVGNMSADDLSLSAPALNLTGAVFATGLLSLNSPGAITQTGGNIIAGTLASDGSDGAISLNQPGNAVLILGGLTASSFSLVDSPELDITGTFSANSASLSAANIALDAPVDVTGVLTLESGGGVSQTAAIRAGTLAGAIGGDADLGAAGNSITALGNFSIGGTLTLADTTPLGISGAVSAAAAKLSADGIDLTGSLMTTGVTDLTSTGGITEATNATLAAASLSGGNTGGDVALLGQNSIASLGSFAFGAADFALADAAPLTVTGPLTGGTATLSAASLNLAGNLLATNALTLASSAGIQQGSGGVNAPNLTLDASGAANLTGNANTISSLSGSAGAVTLTDQQALGVSTLTAANIALTAPSIVLGSGVVALNDLALASPGAITQSAPITAGTLSSGGATDGNATLDASGNAIGTLGSFNASSLRLADAIPLGVAGPVDITVLNLNAPAMTFTGNLTAGTLALASSGGISQSSGVITAGTLTTGAGSIHGSTVLGGANAISTLASVTDLAGFTLVSAAPLSAAGSITAADVALSADGIAITGTIDTGILQLAGGGNVLESGAGVITAAELTTGSFSLAGAALDNPLNAVANIGDFAASGGLVLADAEALNLSGHMQLGGALTLSDPDNVTQTGGTLAAAALTAPGSGIGGDLALNQTGNAIATLGGLTIAGSAAIADAAPLNLAGGITVGGNGLSLTDTGPITQASGIVSTGILNASASAISLPDANVIGTLGSISATGDVLVNGAENLSGPLAASNATLISSGTFTLGGSADITGELTILAAGNVTQTGGVLTAGTLSGTAGTLASFGGTGMVADIGTLGSFTMADSLFQLTDAGPLVITGPVSASTVLITSAGQLVLDGSAGGGLSIAGGLAPPGATLPPSATQSELSAASITVKGAFNINAGQTTPATIFLFTSPGGTGGGNIAFGDGTGLQAPSVDVILAAGSQGEVTGNVNAAQLEILTAKSVNLTGLINGLTGAAAADVVNSVPGPLPQYQFNACQVDVVNCGTEVTINTIIQEAAATTTTDQNPASKLAAPILTASPLENFDISQRKRRRLNRNVQLPGIATHDF